MKYEFPNSIKQAEIISKHLMNVPKNCEKILYSVSNYLLC